MPVQTLDLSEKCDELLSLLKRVSSAKRFVVVTGAGISVNCGIPDFRSSGGIFQQIQKRHPNLVTSGRDLFDASVVFRSQKAADVFYEWMTSLRGQFRKAEPGPVHRFIRTLADRGSLLRNYTQNIDGLEAKAGLNVWDPNGDVAWQKADTVPLHGSMEHLKCQLCSSTYPFDGNLGAGDACLDCSTRSSIREAMGRRALPSGKLRPTVVLYEEPHPHSEDIAKIISHDTRALSSRRSTSKLTDVPGCKQLVKQLAGAATLTVVVNNEPVCGKAWDSVVDFQVIGAAEEWCAKVERLWNAQTKITQWTKARKSANVLRETGKSRVAKENAVKKEDAPANSKTPTGSKKRSRGTDDGDNNADKETQPKKARRHQNDENYVIDHSACRSLRLAEKKDLRPTVCL
ncbi:DHS-like NAD/FAD-binding domain-containing protein [Linderina pennispora]|uniref:DHS-like NAD/FAD-binding domain-containing protein n=1 Tax=Linderina pennispora TaxID=61395 RepID=A0A1Y1WH72_9FUNG|nr:DHS-like NAD/FAD-binding domain-containing protein [Linderina pennispora]ORX72847.1 DHS-like NAD/FAD-binding domain-containing protein [Linderina pennispora]